MNLIRGLGFPYFATRNGGKDIKVNCIYVLLDFVSDA